MNENDLNQAHAMAAAAYAIALSTAVQQRAPDSIAEILANVSESILAEAGSRHPGFRETFSQMTDLAMRQLRQRSPSR